MRIAGVVLMAVALAGCAAVEPPSSADLGWTVAVYNRTQARVFTFREQEPCSVLRLTTSEMSARGIPIPTGVASMGTLQITTPRGYVGTVSVVVTAGASPQVTLGEIAEASLPPCQGQP